MPKLPKRRSHSCNMEIALKRRRLLGKAAEHSHESSTESDEEEEKIIDDSFDISQNFNDKVNYDLSLNILLKNISKFSLLRRSAWNRVHFNINHTCN